MPIRSNVHTDHMNERVLDTLQRFQTIFPEIEITSGYRSPSYNAGVGGARSSRHMHGDAFDFSGRGVSEDRARDAMNWLRSEGAKGFGTYNDGSFHVDWKPGANRAWGPDRHATSLSQTPAWFQENALAHIRGESPDTQYRTVPPGSIPNAQTSAPAPRAVPQPPVRPQTGYAPAPVQTAPAVPQPAIRPQVGYSPGVAPGIEPLASRPVTPPVTPPAPAPARPIPQDTPTIGDGSNYVSRLPLEFRAPPATPPVAPPVAMSPTGSPVRQIPIDGAPALNPNPVTANPAAPAENPLVVRGIRPTSQAPAFGYAPQTVPLPPQRPADSQLFAQPTQTAQAPAENPLVVRGIRPTSQDQTPAPAENPLIVRGIRPTHQDTTPAPFAQQTVPLPPQRPTDSQLFGGYAPQAQTSKPTMWGANYHGPESGLINVMGGSKPDYNSGIQEWRTPQQWMDGAPNVRPQETLINQNMQPNNTVQNPTPPSNGPGTGFFDFVGGLFGGN